MRKPRRGDRFEVEIESIDLKGRSVGTGVSLELPETGSWPTSLRGGIPGERIAGEVIRRRGNRVEVRPLETLRESQHAREPRCAHFGVCGGCSFQSLAYEEQLEFLRAGVERILVARELLEHATVEPVVPCAEPWNYRNKMEFTFGNRRWVEQHEPEGAPADFALGLHVPGRWDKVLHIGACEIQSPRANAILTTLRELAQEQKLEPWDVRAHVGLLRHAVLRVAESTGEIMLNLVTSEEARERIDPYIEAVLARHPAITTIVQNINSRAASTAIGEREIVLHGPGVIREELDGLSFLISAASFFQTNSRQAVELFRIVREEANCQPDDHVFDVYCGTGSLTLNLSRDVRSIVGFELVEEAVVDARRNAELNGVQNAKFIAGDVIATIESHLSAGEAPQRIVVDPPRAGIHPKVLSTLAAVGADRIVYVSCNPKSAATDVHGFKMAGYRLTRVRPVDLFPHTPHIETVLTLDREGVQ